MELPSHVLFALIPELIDQLRRDLELSGSAPSAPALWESFNRSEPTLGEVWLGLPSDLSFTPTPTANKATASRHESPQGYIWVLPDTAQVLKATPRILLLAIGKRRRSGTFHFQSVQHLIDGDGRIETNQKVYIERALGGIRAAFAEHVRKEVPKSSLGSFSSSILDKWGSLES